jgi:glycosyltransferase involved in cell wall biosynthesis
LLPTIVKTLKPLPTALLLVGDYLAGVASSLQPWWRKEFVRLWSWYNQQQQLKAARNSLVFVNSQVLYQKYDGKIRNLKLTRTTTLGKDDFYKRDDTCQDQPIHLLYTGRMDPAKGLLDMVQALSILVRKGEDLILDLVGWPEEGSDVLSRIDSLGQQLGVEDRVFYHGYKAVGPELFAYYKTADIYLMASQTSEGFPRTIWEAMAHSLPVVATHVGSIPYLINDCALVIPPKSPEKIVEAINNLVYNSKLRQRLIRLGFMKAKGMTLEVHINKMCNEITNFIQQK